MAMGSRPAALQKTSTSSLISIDRLLEALGVEEALRLLDPLYDRDRVGRVDGLAGGLVEQAARGRRRYARHEVEGVGEDARRPQPLAYRIVEGPHAIAILEPRGLAVEEDSIEDRHVDSLELDHAGIEEVDRLEEFVMLGGRMRS